MCPLVSRALDRDDALEAAALDPHGAADALRLGLNTLIGRWRDDPAVDVDLCRKGRAWSRSNIPAVLDGEPTHLGRTAELRFVAEAFCAFVPPRDEKARADAHAEAEQTGAQAAAGAVVAGAANPG
jgi:diacylglycerol kinase family enzyme